MPCVKKRKNTGPASRELPDNRFGTLSLVWERCGLEEPLDLSPIEPTDDGEEGEKFHSIIDEYDDEYDDYLFLEELLRKDNSE